MEHHFVPVDFANLMDSIRIADQRGGRIRLADRRSVDAFLAENHLKKSRFEELVATHGLPIAAIIATGLMKGLYAYSVDAQQAFVYVATDREIIPLRRYHGEMCFDLALSYASEELKRLVLPLQAELQARGVAVYLLNVEEAPKEPLWGIRFREGLFHSRFFVPVLTEDYLARGGTAVELFDIARATVEHRADEFFYPLIPLVRDASELPSQVFARRGPEAGRFDPQAFEWVRTHVFSVPLSRKVDWLASFFASLARNARGCFDSGFLHCLSSAIDWLELIETERARYAQFLIKSPALTYHYFVMRSDGGVKYLGMGEPTPQARPGRDFPDPAGAILDWLGLERVEGPGAAPPRPRPAEGPRTEAPPASEPPEPPLPASWFCPNCHFTGAPEWRKPFSPERRKELGIVLRYSAGLPMCPSCGRTTMIGR